MGPVENILQNRQLDELDWKVDSKIVDRYCMLTWRVSDHVCPLIAFTICRWEAEKLCPAPRLASTASGLWVW